MRYSKPRRSINFDESGQLLSDSGRDSLGMSGKQSNILTVGMLTSCIKGILETEELLKDVWVRGEISNLTCHANGHVYFSLKDQTALIRCVIWASIAKNRRFNLSDGMGVIIRGKVGLYEKMGQYQLTVSEVTPDGVGALYVAYEKLKARLQAEGLFEAERKKPLVRYPRRVAIITSRTAAALRDMVTVANRRCCSADIVLIPSLMQGAGAEDAVVSALRLADSLPDVDVIILGRGGGSIEDLWTFNTESVARAICACEKPVVSAIGHETDYTLADLVADLRAPTPSAAAELVFPDRNELLARVRSLADAMSDALREGASQGRNRLDALMRSRCFARPEELLQSRWQTLDLLTARLASSAKESVAQYEGRFGMTVAKLDALSPLRVLARGYAVVRRADDRSIVEEASRVKPGDVTETLLPIGRLISEVKETHEGWE